MKAKFLESTIPLMILVLFCCCTSITVSADEGPGQATGPGIGADEGQGPIVTAPPAGNGEVIGTTELDEEERAMTRMERRSFIREVRKPGSMKVILAGLRTVNEGRIPRVKSPTIRYLSKVENENSINYGVEISWIYCIEPKEGAKFPVLYFLSSSPVILNFSKETKHYSFDLTPYFKPNIAEGGFASGGENSEEIERKSCKDF